MSALLAIPLEIRVVVVGLLAALLAGQINRGIYRLAWHPRNIGPWSPPDPKAPPRKASDYLPVLGWWGLRREASLHGAGYWVRPLLLELCVSVGFAALYAYEVRGGLVPQVPAAPPVGPLTLHLQFLAHAILISLLIVATFIDFDEQTIPDEITVSGTLLGLLLLCLLPAMQPLIPVRSAAGVSVEHLVLTSSQTSLAWRDGLGGPQSWPGRLDAARGLLYGLACYLGWCFAILPKRWTLRRGWRKAIQYFFASIARHSGSIIVGALAVVGSVGIVAGWWWGGEHWQSLLSSLVGLAFAGGLIWAVRIVGGYALQREAMGFGDVTLMAMIGTFVGWQPSLIIFFLAPFAALFISLTQWLLTRRRDIAFGPYLSLATVMLLLAWPVLWPSWAAGIFGLGWLVPAIVGACLVLMAGLLSLMRVGGELIDQAAQRR